MQTNRTNLKDKHKVSLGSDKMFKDYKINHLIVPNNKDNYYNYYTIEKGDTLYAIGRKYNIHPELLASINGIEMENYIYPGQELLIPKSGYSYYITKDGDTLDTVSKVFQISKEEVLRRNGTIYLNEGQILVNPSSGK